MQSRLAILLLAPALALAATGCKAKFPAITEPWAEDFERADLGPDWKPTGPEYRIEGGKVKVAGARNHPLWLQRRLPRNVVIELDVESASPEGDIKVELFGDGKSFDPDQGQYDPTGYVLVFGGWGNAQSIIGRLGEHGAAVKAETRARQVGLGIGYRFTITRKGGLIDWRIDGDPFLSWTDPEPLQGEGHEFFALNNWESKLTFDAITIKPAN